MQRILQRRDAGHGLVTCIGHFYIPVEADLAQAPSEAGYRERLLEYV